MRIMPSSSSWFVFLSTLLLVAGAVSGCRGDGPLATSPTTTSAPTTLPSVRDVVEFDCLGDVNCPQVVVEGDPPAELPSGAPAPLRGLSDATIRLDPMTDTLVMAYSWPSIHIGTDGARGTRVETHLARSGDGGRTWQAAGVLWAAEPANDPVSGAAGSTDHEVPNLLPIREPDGDAVRWIGARLDLFVPSGGTLARRPPSSFRIAVLAAPDPESLARAEPAILASAATHPGWGIDVDLAGLAEGLARCTLWNEPALHYDEGTLFLVLRCLPLGQGGTPDVTASTLEVFATEPAGDPNSWQWRYAGQLAGADEAAELGGEGLTQIELAESRDGTLIAILTPDRWDSTEEEFVHLGLRVVEVASLHEPALARDDDSQLVVRAVITASDLVPLGPGAGAYEPAAEIGIVLMRREIGPASLVASLHDTRIHP